MIESYNKINEELKATQAAAKELSEKTATLEQEVKEASTNVGQLANRAYKSGRFSDANTLLTLSDSQDLMAGLSVLEQLAQARNDEVAAYTATERGTSRRRPSSTPPRRSRRRRRTRPASARPASRAS